MTTEYNALEMYDVEKHIVCIVLNIALAHNNGNVQLGCQAKDEI